MYFYRRKLSVDYFCFVMEKLLQSFRISRPTFCTILKEPHEALGCLHGRSRLFGRALAASLPPSKVAGLPRTFKVYGLLAFVGLSLKDNQRQSWWRERVKLLCYLQSNFRNILLDLALFLWFHPNPRNQEIYIQV